MRKETELRCGTERLNSQLARAPTTEGIRGASIGPTVPSLKTDVFGSHLLFVAKDWPGPPGTGPIFVTNSTKFVMSLTKATTRGTVEMVVSLAIGTRTS